MATTSRGKHPARQQGTKSARRYRSGPVTTKREREADKAARSRAKERKAVTRDFDQLTSLGLYTPRKTVRRRKGVALLSPGQAKYLKRKKRQAGHLLHDFIALKPKGSAATQKATIKAARDGGYRTTGKAVFVSKKGGLKKARLVAGKKGEPAKIVEQFKHESRDVILADFDLLMLEKEKLRTRFERAAARAKGKRLRFYVGGKYGSQRTFAEDEFDDLWAELQQYWEKQAHLYSNVRQLAIGRIGKGKNKVVTKRDREIAAARRKAKAKKGKRG